MQRRALLLAAAATGGAALLPGRRMAPTPCPVAVLKANSYEVDFEDIISRGLRECGIDVKGKVALVKPNLVEYVPGSPIHTHPTVLAGCIAALERQGARVIVGEGPGHRRDTIDMAHAAGYHHAIERFDSRFADLNLDDTGRVNDFCGRSFHLSATALQADVIVSLAKMKTHHWAGVTLSMKNLFGTVPGAVYGWPKNILHQCGIDRSIAALHRTFAKTIGIVDGVVGMEGNGPIQGLPNRSGVLIIGRDLPAVDMACCSLMGIAAERIGYLERFTAAGTAPRSLIHRAEDPSRVSVQYQLIKRMSHLRI